LFFYVADAIVIAMDDMRVCVAIDVVVGVFLDDVANVVE